MMRRPRVLITRAADQTKGLAGRLQALGIDPVAVPAVAVVPPVSWDGVDEALWRLAEYDWVLFTSANGVRAFFRRRQVLGLRDPLPPALRWAAIGPGTAAALVHAGAGPVWLPSRYLGEAAGTELPASLGQRALRVRGEAASPAAMARLRARGIAVDEVIAYRTVEGPPESDGLLQRAWVEGVDAIVFTSASTVRGFARLSERVRVADDLSGIRIFAIGPVTAEAVRAMGWSVEAVAAQHSLEGIIQAIVERRTALVTDPATS